MNAAAYCTHQLTGCGLSATSWTWIVVALTAFVLIMTFLAWPRRRRSIRHMPPVALICRGTGTGQEGRTHFHDTFAEVDRCEAGVPPPVPEDEKPAKCPRCQRNHFGEECPPAGHRVTDGRTGEVVGYWRG